MATPSSSGTSPSPALSYTLPTSVSENSADEPNDNEQAEREEQRKKLLARTEFAKITRALRTTLAFASYKAKHNLANVPLSTLEARVAQRNHFPNGAPTGQAVTPALFPATFGNDKKRKATSSASNTNFYNSPLAQGTSNYGAGLGTNTASTSMSMPSQHASYTFPPPSPNMSSSPANPSKSLFASILALPPAKRARTIHNPEAPPVPPPLPPPQPPSRRSPKKSTKKAKESPTAAKGRAADKKGKGKEREKKPLPGRRRGTSISSVHTHSSFADTENVNDTDMKAAETLTDLLLSRTGGTASPRSSFSAPTSSSRVGRAGPAAHTLSQASSGSSMAASAASQYRTHVRTGSNASTASAATSIVEGPAPVATDMRHSVTPTSTPRLTTRTTTTTTSGSGSLSAQASHIFGPSSVAAPGQRADDSEAAGLMLLLANSPSPARPTARDHDISRNAYAAGRVLFPSGPSGGSDRGGGGSETGSTTVGRGLKRSVGGSSISSLDSGDGGRRENGRSIRAGSETATSPPSSQGEISPPHVPRTVIAPPIEEESEERSTTPPASAPPSEAPSPMTERLLPSPPSLTQTGPHTPAPAFRLTDYINVTPSPAAVPAAGAFSSPNGPPQAPTSSSASSQLCPPPLTSGSGPGTGTGGAAPSRFGAAVSVSSPLRKSFDRENLTLGSNLPGRRLFENEPGGTGTGPSSDASGAGAGGGHAPMERKMRFGDGGERPGSGSLGSGIDLVQSLK